MTNTITTFFTFVDGNPVLILFPSLTIGGILIIALLYWATTPSFEATADKLTHFLHPKGMLPLPTSEMMDYSAATICPILSITVLLIIMLVLRAIGDLDDHFILLGTIGITIYLFIYGIAYALYRPAAEASEAAQAAQATEAAEANQTSSQESSSCL